MTLQGNLFNSANKLVKLDGSSKLPPVDGSQLINVTASNVSAAQDEATQYDENAPREDSFDPSAITTVGTVTETTIEGTVPVTEAVVTTPDETVATPVVDIAPTSEVPTSEAMIDPELLTTKVFLPLVIK